MWEHLKQMVNYCAKLKTWVNHHQSATIIRLHHCSVTRTPEWHFQVIDTKRRQHLMTQRGWTLISSWSEKWHFWQRRSCLPRLRPFANNLIWSYFTSKLVTFASHFYALREIGERSLAIPDCCCCLFLKVNRAICKEYFRLLSTLS